MRVTSILCCISFHRVNCTFWSACIEAVRDVCSASARNESLSLSFWTRTRWTVCFLIAMHMHVWVTQKTRLDRLIDSDISIRLIAALTINRLIGQIVTALKTDIWHMFVRLMIAFRMKLQVANNQTACPFCYCDKLQPCCWALLVEVLPLLPQTDICLCLLIIL